MIWVRVLFFLAVLIAAVVGPWWFVYIAALIGYGFKISGYELLVAGLFLDGAHSFIDPAYWNLPFHTIIITCLCLVIPPFRQMLRPGKFPYSI